MVGMFINSNKFFFLFATKGYCDFSVVGMNY